MDLTPTEEQRELVDLAARILGDACTPEALNARDRAGTTAFDRALWGELAGAGLLGVGVPEEYGGLGFGFLETCLLLEQVGRVTAPVPAQAVLGVAVPVLAAHGSEQRVRLLPGICAGSTIVTAALAEVGGDPFAPATTAVESGGGWRLTGTKTGVPAGTEADFLLVSADYGLFLVAADDLAAHPQPVVGAGVDALVELAGAPGEKVGGADTVADAVRYAIVAGCAVSAGVVAAAIELTAGYVREREAFGRPLATFQAVGQRAADGFTAAWAVRLAALEAAWALADGRDADLEVHTAKALAADRGLVAMRAAQHLHGGIGLHAEYPLHRHTAWAKRAELGLGGAADHLERLGALIASESSAEETVHP
jgi:alkylation response protein AidB-like acyl-CoA dehydrogenase